MDELTVHEHFTVQELSSAALIRSLSVARPTLSHGDVRRHVPSMFLVFAAANQQFSAATAPSFFGTADQSLSHVVCALSSNVLIPFSRLFLSFDLVALAFADSRCPPTMGGIRVILFYTACCSAVTMSHLLPSTTSSCRSALIRLLLLADPSRHLLFSTDVRSDTCYRCTFSDVPGLGTFANPVFSCFHTQIPVQIPPTFYSQYSNDVLQISAVTPGNSPKNLRTLSLSSSSSLHRLPTSSRAETEYTQYRDYRLTN